MAKKQNEIKNQDKELLDIAIVGGGISGLYAAWRIKVNWGEKCNDNLKVSLFEASERIGGRLLSISIPGVGMRAELGAMRYSTRHRLLTRLIADWALPREFFNVPDPAFFIRGRRLTSNSVRNGSCRHCSATIPYNVKREESGKLPAELIIDAIWRALADLNFAYSENDKQKTQRVLELISQREIRKKEDWLFIKKYGRFKDTHLYDIGFWNLLQHFLSNEAFLLIHDGLGYESILSNWNAAEAIPWFINDFDPSQEMLMVSRGFTSLATVLTKRIEEENVNIKTNSKLLRLTKKIESGDVFWELEFENGSLVYSKQIILALPKGPLTKLIVNDESGNLWEGWKNLKSKFDAVSSERLFKLFLVYEHPWWQGYPLPGSIDGRVFTDLPVRQVYYFGPEWIKRHSTREQMEKALSDLQDYAKNDLQISLVMASYSDAHYVNFWHPFTPKNIIDYSNIGPKYYRQRLDIYTKKADEELKRIVDLHGVPERMVLKIQQQLAELHGVPTESIPDPITAICMDWGNNLFNGGWHTWDVHEKPWEFTNSKEMKVLHKNRLYICGEAFSGEQGWIEGALKSTEKMLMKISEDEGHDIVCTYPDWFSSKKEFMNYIE